MTELESFNIFSYSWSYRDEETTNGLQCIIRVYGLNEKNESVLARIENFQPCFYVELPDHIEWTEARVQVLSDKLRKLSTRPSMQPTTMHFELKHRTYFAYIEPKEREEGESKNESSELKYQHQKFPYLLMLFASSTAMGVFASMLRREIQITGLGRMKLKCHSSEPKITPVLKLMGIRSLPASGWISGSGIRMKGVNKESTKKREYAVSYHDLEAMSEELASKMPIVAPKVFSFDNEANSTFMTKFPKSSRPDDKVFQIGITIIDPPSTVKKTGVKYRKFMISYGPLDQKIVGDDVTIIDCKCEADVLCGFTELIKKEDPELILGYNIIGWDIEYMLDRASKICRCLSEFDQLGCIEGEHAPIAKISWSSSAHGKQEFNYLAMEGRVIVDLLPYIRSNYKLPNYRLETVCDEYLKTNKDPIKPKDIFRAYRAFTKEALSPIAKYCCQDSFVTALLYEKLLVWYDLSESATTCKVPMFDYYTQGQQIKMYSAVYEYGFLNNIVIESNGYQSKDEEHFTGAFVSEPIKGLYKLIAPLDFASLYPSIMMAYNIDYSKFVVDEKIPDEDCHVFIWSEHKCIAEGTMISLENMSVPIEKLNGNKNIVTYDNEKNGLILGTQKNYFNNGIKECIELTFHDGTTLRCTNDHKILTSENNWQEAGKLKIGSDVKAGYTPPIVDIEYEIKQFGDWSYKINDTFVLNMQTHKDYEKTMAYARLIGLLMTDGHNSDKDAFLYLGHELDCQSVQRDLEILGATKLDYHRQKYCWTVRIPRNISRIFIDSSIIKGAKINQKIIIPDFLLDGCPLPVIREFLGGFFGGDGLTSCYNSSINAFTSFGYIQSKVINHLDNLKDLNLQILKMMNKFGNFADTKAYYKELDGKISLTQRFNLESVPLFMDKIGFRYCLHKNQRCHVVRSYIHMRDNTNIQVKKVLDLISQYRQKLPDDLVEDIYKHICDKCDEKFTNITDLKTHISVHHVTLRDKDFQCDICGNKYSSNTNLKRHVCKGIAEIVDDIKSINIEENKEKENLDASPPVNERVTNTRYIVKNQIKLWDGKRFRKVCKSEFCHVVPSYGKILGIAETCYNHRTNNMIHYQTGKNKRSWVASLQDIINYVKIKIRNQEPDYCLNLITYEFVVNRLKETSKYSDVRTSFRRDKFMSAKDYLDMIGMTDSFMSEDPHTYALKHIDIALPSINMKVIHKCNIGPQQVYDLEIDEHHCFSANSIIVHNCCPHDPDNTKEKKLKDGRTNKVCATYKYRFLKAEVSGKGIIPTLLELLISMRKKTRKQIGINEDEIKFLLRMLSSEKIPKDEILKEVMTRTKDGPIEVWSAIKKWLIAKKTILGKEIIELINQRIKTVTEINLVLDKRQLSYKISANSMYGACGVRQGYLPFLPGAMCVTYVGRRSILLANEHIEKYFKGKVIYNDTDSAYTYFPHLVGKSVKEIWDYCWMVSREVSKLYRKPMQLDFEGKIYVQYLILSKKRYAAKVMNEEGEIEKKLMKRGIVLQRRDNCICLRNAYETALLYILEKTDVFSEFTEATTMKELKNIPEVNYLLNMMIDAVNDLFQWKYKAKDFVITKNVTKDAKEYKTKSLPAHVFLAQRMIDRGIPMGANSRVEYVLCDRSARYDKNRKQTDKIEDISYFNEFKEIMRLSRITYFENQFIKPIDQLLSVGVRVKDFFKRHLGDRISKIKTIERMNVLFAPKLEFIDEVDESLEEGRGEREFILPDSEIEVTKQLILSGRDKKLEQLDYLRKTIEYYEDDDFEESTNEIRDDLLDHRPLIKPKKKKVKKDIENIDEIDDINEVEGDVKRMTRCKTSGIYTDGGHNKLTGDEAWGCVVDADGIDLLSDCDVIDDLNSKVVTLPVGVRRVLISKFNDVSKQQNNGAELLALLVGLRMAVNNVAIKKIYCDSDLMIKYWSTGYVTPTIKKKMDKRKLAYIVECAKLRKIFELSGGKIVKVSGDNNLADLGVGHQ